MSFPQTRPDSTFVCCAILAVVLAEQVNVGLWELYWRDHAAIDLSKGTA